MRRSTWRWPPRWRRDSISATATDLTANETSEFSACITATNTAPVLDAGSNPDAGRHQRRRRGAGGCRGHAGVHPGRFRRRRRASSTTSPTPTRSRCWASRSPAPTRSNGAWWISTDNGASWSALGAVSRRVGARCWRPTAARASTSSPTPTTTARRRAPSPSAPGTAPAAATAAAPTPPPTAA